MTSIAFRCLLAGLAAAAALPAAAEGLAISASSAGSSASSAGSASLRGSSDSISASSNSSRNDRAVLDGDYRVAGVQPVDGKPDHVRLTLSALDGDAAAGFRLDLPRAALGTRPIAPGDRITTRTRAYGVEFSRGEPREPFFLVLDDTWHRELQTRVLTQ